jgi:microsomal epoxide hydrolase
MISEQLTDICIRRIGEKMLAWADPSTTPSLDTILANVSLYWLTDTFQTSLYHYRSTDGRAAVEAGLPNTAGPFHKKFGYSAFPFELLPVIPAWVHSAEHGDLIWSKRHDKVGPI